jgi:DNA-binding SARP family transcriptional activator
MVRTSGLEFRVLGLLEVRRGGGPIAAGRGAALNLLAGLLLSANSVVPADALAEMAWDGRQPRHPRAALQTAVSRLRHLLGEEVIETVPGGYRLRVDAGCLDLLRFDDLACVAADADADADVQAALDEAIGLWRGTPLANVDSAALHSEAVPRLVQRYLAVCEQWAGVCLRLGRANVVADRLGPLAAAHPFRETLAGQLVLALNAAGRRADALAAYDTVRRALRDELGVDPGPALQDIHVRVLRAGAGEPGHDAGAAGRRQPRWSGRGPVPGALIGRNADQQALADALVGHRAVTVLGTAGVGKTELALQTAGHLAAGFADGVAVAELGTLPAQVTDDMKAVSGVILAAAGGRADPAQPAWEALLDELRSRELLLVIDNAEHVFAACSRIVDLARPLLPRRAGDYDVTAAAGVRR